jgi:DNA (cytosine-5)-methyltransferase 1
VSLRYLSVCSGIEAATVAWHPLGWQPWAFSEIEAFPSAVLKHHYPTVPNLGDMTRFQEWPDAVLDLLVGGTPCQSFSVAGLRQGLADPRGSLLLTYLAIADRYRPRWLVWENVPGVLSADDGRAFGSLLGGLAELGYGFAYRVLDAQYFGLAQRRKRVFVVGHLGDWRRAAAVLFERESLSGHPAPRRETREGITCSPGGIAGSCSSKWSKGTGGPAGDEHYNLIAGTIGAEMGRNRGLGNENEVGLIVPFDTTQITHQENRSNPQPDGPSPTLAKGTHPSAIAYGIRSDAGRSGEARTPSPDAEGRVRLRDAGFNVYEEVAPTIDAGAAHAVGFADPVAANQARTYTREGSGNFRLSNVAHTTMAVRRLTPRECERLQGFPDDYTLIPYRGKLAADGPRYKALGNSMAVPVMAWIGRRIQMVEAINALEAVS